MDKNHLPVYDETKCTLFALGRNAMYATCQMLKIGPDDEVLTPAFDCDSSLQPFKVLGIKLRFFRSDPYTFTADIGDIKKRINLKTRLIHIINYFGMPQPWEKLLSLRKETEIPIMEDNAYSLFSKYNNQLFGTFGDMAIFSLRKNLAIIDGGMLRINNPVYNFKMSSRRIPFFYLTEPNGILTVIKSSLGYHNMPAPLKRFLRRLNSPPPLYSEKENGYPNWPLRDKIESGFSRDYLRPMSGFARRQLNGFSEDEFTRISEKKRHYYGVLSERLSRIKGLTVLWPRIPEGVVPFAISLLVDSKRDALLEALRYKYEIMAWPTLPQAILDRLDEYPEVETLGRKILQINLPADRVLNPDFFKYTEDIVRDINSFVEGHISS